MYVLASVAAVSLLVLLGLEGVSFFASTEGRPHMRWFGGLTLLLGAAIALLQVLLLNTTLVYSPEFCALLVQGTWARYVLEVVLGCVAIAAAMLWHVARLNDGSRSNAADASFALLAVAGLIVAAATVLHIHPLQGEVEPQVYAFDLWWPPLVAWLVICAAQAAEILVGITGKMRRPAVTAVALVGVGSLALDRPEYVDAASREIWVILYGLAALVFLVLAGVGTFRRAEKSWWEWFRTHAEEGRKLQFKSLAQIVGAMLPVLAFGRIVHLDTAGPSFALSALALTWIILAEAFGGEPLIAASRWPVVRSFRENGSIRAAATLVWKRICDLTAAMMQRLRPAPSQEQGTAAASAKASFGITAVRALIGLAVLIVISDVPNAGRTIIYPFEPGDLTSEKSLAQEFPTWVLHEISLLQRELTPLMIVVSRKEGDRITAAPVVNEIDAAISKSSDLEYGSVKIPLNLFVTPIQTPVRKLLGARVITGALHGDARSYSVVATSNAGEIWSASAPSTGEGGAAVKPVDALNTLASRLAFEIVATSIPPAAGLTRSADAFDEFRQGLAAWKQYQQEDWDALPAAIAHFRAAVAKDPSFSLAHYRLGVALQEDARPSAAAEAFTASIAANPTFSPSYVARAHVLYYFDWYRDRLPAAAAVDTGAQELTSGEQEARTVARISRVDEARRLWRKVLTLDEDLVTREDRAASYFGLCSAAHDSSERESAYVAYYYCRRAEELYARLQSEDPQIIAAHAMVLDTLGVILDARQMTETVQTTSDWHCSENSIDWESVSDDGTISKRKINTGPYLRNARVYYERAMALAPLDSIIRCNAASVAYALGDPEPMQALERTPDAHQQLADAIPENAAHPLRAHRVALNEYEQAVLRDPANTDARNGYAYRFWQWQYAAAQRKVAPPELALAARAEVFAREGVRLGDVTGGSRSHQALLESTFGEVLLAQGRSHEAIAILRKAKNLAPKHTAFDQIRWDLAQANRCAVAADRSRPSLGTAIEAEILQNLKEAAELAAILDADDRLRETPPGEGNRMLDPAGPSPACIAPPAPETPLFTLVNATASRREPCAWMGVSGRLESGQQEAWLRVFGHDVNRSIPLDGASYAFLGSTPADTHGDYFARLEDKTGTPLSPTYAIDTYPNDGDNTCSRNLITLTFRGTSRSSNPTGTR